MYIFTFITHCLRITKIESQIEFNFKQIYLNFYLFVRALNHIRNLFSSFIQLHEMQMCENDHNGVSLMV